MEVKKIYHGSKDIIEKPIHGQGKVYNDYGLGFYCTEVKEMAMEWAVDRQRNGYANCYEVDCEGMKILNLCSEEYSMMHWLSILVQNRQFHCTTPLAREAKKYLKNTFYVDTDSYDIIEGYRADDSYFSFAQDFLNGMISYRQLCHAMKLGKLGLQIVMKSPRVFERIHFVGYQVAKAEEWYDKKQLRDQKARSDYFHMDKAGWIRGDIYMPQILDEEMTANDSRLR